MCEIEESSPILPTILENQEQIYDDDKEEEASVSVVDKDAFTTIGVSLHNDEANDMKIANITEKEAEKTPSLQLPKTCNLSKESLGDLIQEQF